MDRVLTPLFAAYAVLKLGRDARAPLEIESSERRIHFGADGKIASITARASLPAHKLIEEFMIQANVCAAETLEQRRTPLIYRVHDAPSDEKIQNLVDFLETLGIRWSKGQPATTARFVRMRTSSTRWCSALRCRRSTTPTISATSASTSLATPTSPRRSAATPT
jgi:ribonuclease R